MKREWLIKRRTLHTLKKFDMAEIMMDGWVKSPSWRELGMKELEGQRMWEKYPRKYRKEGWTVMGMYWEDKKNLLCGRESDGDEGAGEKKKRKTEGGVVG